MNKRLLSIAIGLAAVLVVWSLWFRRATDDFEQSMAQGQGYLEKGDATNAIAAYSRSAKLAAESVDAHLNLANAYLLAGASRAVVEQCQAAVALDHNDPAADYLMGCAFLRFKHAAPAGEAVLY